MLFVSSVYSVILPNLIQYLVTLLFQVIVLKTLEAINVMVKYSGDFLRKRMTTEFLPSAVHFLDTNSKIFTKDRSKFTQLHRVQQKLLSYLGDIVPTLEVSKEVFCDVATVCARYINCRLHEAIQEVCYRFINAVSVYCTTAIWFQCEFAISFTI